MWNAIREHHESVTTLAGTAVYRPREFDGYEQTRTLYWLPPERPRFPPVGYET